MFLAIFLVAGSCSVKRQFIVTGLGYEPDEYAENYIYALPKHVLKIGVTFEKEVFVPGPYGDYAMKLLGISEVQRKRAVRYSITHVQVESLTETDGEQIYSLNMIEGASVTGILDSLEQHGLVINEHWLPGRSGQMRSCIREPLNEVPFPDVTMESNIQTRTETIYKTILTDTSFIQVPVQTEQLEQKTLERKAEEAAKFILELRADRYYLSAGLLDPYPPELELQTALEKLDQLEKEYLSLFMGKQYTLTGSREFFVTPGDQIEPQTFLLDRFSELYGFTSIDEQAEDLTVTLTSMDKTGSLRYLLPQLPDPEVYNRIYYRLPEMVLTEVRVGEKNIGSFRLPVFQMGALVNIRVK